MATKAPVKKKAAPKKVEKKEPASKKPAFGTPEWRKLHAGKKGKKRKGSRFSDLKKEVKGLSKLVAKQHKLLEKAFKKK